MAGSRKQYRKGEPKVIVTIKCEPDAEDILDNILECLKDNENIVLYEVESEQDNVIILHIYEES